MSPQVREIMTPNPLSVQTTDTLESAARVMRDNNIGNVLVMDGDQFFGILTDRDIVVRGIAQG